MHCKFNVMPVASAIESHVTILLDDGKDVSFTTKGAIQALRILTEFLSRAVEELGTIDKQTTNKQSTPCHKCGGLNNFYARFCQWCGTVVQNAAIF